MSLLLVGGGIFFVTIVLVVAIASAKRAMNTRKNGIALTHLAGVCDEFERGYKGQLLQLGHTPSIEGRLRARLIAVCYIMQGMIDLEQRTNRAVVNLSISDKWVIASGVAAKPLNILGGPDEARLRSVTNELIASMLNAIEAHDIESLSENWKLALVASGYRRNLDALNDRRVDGWSLQSATAGMKSWSELVAHSSQEMQENSRIAGAAPQCIKRLGLKGSCTESDPLIIVGTTSPRFE